MSVGVQVDASNYQFSPDWRSGVIATGQAEAVAQWQFVDKAPSSRVSVSLISAQASGCSPADYRLTFDVALALPPMRRRPGSSASLLPRFLADEVMSSDEEEVERMDVEDVACACCAGHGDAGAAGPSASGAQRKSPKAGA